MQSEPTTVEKLRGLPWSVATNAVNAVFSQFTFFGSVFVLFLNSVGLTKTEIGFILSLIPFSAILAPLVAPFAERHGYKRIFVIFYAARKTITALLLLTPWVYGLYGTRGVFLYIAVVVALFATVRTISETAYYPWVIEFVPNSVRGKYSAMSNIFTALTGFVAVWVAGQILGHLEGSTGFMILFAIGAISGYISVWASTFIPGGKSSAGEGKRNLTNALKDSDFRRYLVGVGLVTLGTVPIAAFLPLFMEELGGLSSANVVQVQMGNLLGMLLSSYLWGWAADRFGSKPVMQVGGWLLVLLPVLWWLVPRMSSFTLGVALCVAFLQGMSTLGWGIGAGRLLYVSIVPVEMKLDYMAVYFAFVGIVAGCSQFVGGAILDAAHGLSGSYWGIELNPYVPLFLLAILLPLVAILLFRSVHGDSSVSTMQFAGIFLRGNPILAMGSMIRFYRAKDEEDAVAVTDRMGQIRSRLTVDELLDALADPRFNVRFEAILAIARMPADPRLTDALVQILQSKSPALSVVAAWAMGRMGARDAVPSLRGALDSRYRSVQGYSARALATLGDVESAPELLARLAHEEDDGLRLAYASALGKLRIEEALPTLLARLCACDDESICAELALAVARLIGNERSYIQLARAMRSQPGTTFAQTLAAARRHFVRARRRGEAITSGLQAIEDDFAREQLDHAARSLGAWMEHLPAGWYRSAADAVIREVASQLQRLGYARPEYVLLALHTLTEGLAD
ncbi:MAG: HEAT repeat domain-containing protein [Caldilineaceae bacterium]|nr:HEAT repeat domain-containing protein [Caldilineaceae bacterium]